MVTFGKEIRDTLLTEFFVNINKVHDWRNYVPDELKECWYELTDRERYIIYLLCEERATMEDWD
jgi:hypothetical protein